MPDPYIDPSYWEPPDDPDAEDRFFVAFTDAVRGVAHRPAVFVVASVDEHATADVDGVYATLAAAENRVAYLTKATHGKQTFTVWERPIEGDTTCSACGTAPADGSSCECFTSAVSSGDQSGPA